MAYLMLSGAESTKLTSGSGLAPSGLGSIGLNFHKRCFFKKSVVSYGNKCVVPRCSISSLSPASQPGFKEGFWFYRFLATIVYDHVINPCHWTEDMRDEALEPVDIYDRKMRVVDVEGGTAFTTLGIVKHVDAKNVTIIDQSPHQLAKATKNKKEPLKECKIIEGDAEDLPFPTDCADRYISAGR
ncbi:37 kDa inner envelope membrane protein, chloroplastic [Glycine soja]|nr:37 kDa inner envelope membrane protein, chloroplastic [Glycine soja]